MLGHSGGVPGDGDVRAKRFTNRAMNVTDAVQNENCIQLSCYVRNKPCVDN
jgi:hypothetical protein